jgi:endonuclease/exonuclease/phosphatase family metal-dependent hydrolase
MTSFKKFLKAIIIVLIIALIGFVGLITFAVITDYNPGEKEVIFTKENAERLSDTTELSLLTWNIGYCGLDKDMDFFYDGGKKVFTPKIRCINNMITVNKFLKQNDSSDFIFIQEIDKGSKRSYYLNEYDSLNHTLNNFSSYFGINYDVFFVPVPPTSPMGKVLSGIAIYSKYQPSSSVRYSFPGKYGFPKQLFMLDRCFLVNRYPITTGKELLVINTHNEAYDAGHIRKVQMDYLREIILKEYEKGNYIIIGGDWNQIPPDFNPSFADNKVKTGQMKVAAGHLPDQWKWVYDSTAPTNRSIVTAYDPDTTVTTVIDFFLLSPNIEDIYVKCINLNFQNSDHNPVKIKVKLKRSR